MFLQEDSFFFKFQNNHLGFGTLAYSVYIYDKHGELN